MAKLFNRAKMTTSTTGTGTITLGSASNGFQSFADAGVANGDVVQYVIEEGSNFEIGTGTYTATGTTLSRSPTESSNSDNAISLAGNATVSITAVAADMNRLQHNGSDKVTVSSTGASVTGNISVTGTVDGRDVATDGSKLDGIESGADVTDTANVTAAGALMDSEVTNLAQVKAFDSSDYATAAQGTKADNALPKAGGTMTGAITFASGQTFDGRDVSADGSKLDGIESGATADQTAAEIRSLVESASDSNVFTDADHTKLNGIEAGAEVNDPAFKNIAVSGQTTVVADADADTLNLAAGSNVTITTNASTDTVTISSTDTNTVPNDATITISAGTDLSGGGSFTTDQSSNETITINHADTSTLSGTYGSVGDGTKIDQITVDANGHVTAITTGATGDIKGVTAGSGLSGGGTSGTVTVSHADTSTQASVNNSGRTYIQDITLDTYGHVTGISSATETVTAPTVNNATITISAGTDLTTGGNFTTNQGTNETITINHADTSTLSGTYGSTANGTKIDQITVDARGHVTAITTGPAGYTTTFQLEDGDGTEVTISHGKEVKFVEGTGIDINWTDTSTGSDGDPYDMTFAVTSAPKWTTSRTLSLSGDASGSVSWDGSANATLSVTVADDSHNHTIANVDGLQTALDGKLSTTGKAADSELLDGVNGASYLRSDADDNVTGHTEWQDNYSARFGNGADFRIYHNGSHTYLRNYNHSAGNIYIQGENTSGTNQGLIYGRCDAARTYVQLYENSSERLRTLSGGVGVTGITVGDVDANPHNANGIHVSNTNNEKIVLSGSTDPYIRWQEGTTDKAYIQWASGQDSLVFRNQQTENFDFMPDGSTGAVKLRLRGSDNDTWGAVYADDNSDTGRIGFLDDDQNWAYRITSDTSHEWLINNTVEMSLSASTLDMKGNTITEVEDIGLRDRIYHDGDTNTYMQFHAADQWRVVTGGTERLEVNNSHVEAYTRIKAAGGSSGGYFFSSVDFDTGIYVPSDGNLAFDVNGSERVRIDGNGKIGVGTSAPSSEIHVVKNTSTTARVETTGGTNSWARMSLKTPSQEWAWTHAEGYNSNRLELYNATQNAVSVSVETDGTLNVIKSTNQYSAYPTGNWGAKVLNNLDASTEGGLVVANRWANSSSTPFLVGGLYDAGNGFDDFFRVDGSGQTTTSGNATFNSNIYCSSGAIYVNTTTATNQGRRLHISDSASNYAFSAVKIENTNTSAGRVITLNSGRTSGSTEMIVFDVGNSDKGSIDSTTSGTTYNTTSDYRLKENIVDLTGAINRVKLFSPKRFNFIDDPDDTTVDGFLAHEAATVVPNAVTGEYNAVQVWQQGEELPDGVSVGDKKLDDDGNAIPKYQKIDHSKLVPLLTAALQEAITKIETLETKVAALEAN